MLLAITLAIKEIAVLASVVKVFFLDLFLVFHDSETICGWAILNFRSIGP